MEKIFRIFFNEGENTLIQLIESYNSRFNSHFRLVEMIYDECVFADIATSDEDESIFYFGVFISQHTTKKCIEGQR